MEILYGLVIALIIITLINKHKLNTIMAQIDDLNAKLAETSAKVDELQATVDLEQEQIANLLAINAQVVADQQTLIEDLKQQLENAGEVDLSGAIATLESINEKLVTSKEDLAATVVDEGSEGEGEETEG